LATRVDAASAESPDETTTIRDIPQDQKTMEDTMTAPTFLVIPSVEMVASQFQATHMRTAHAFDAFAKARMHDAVPQWQLRRAQRELDRCRRLMRAKNKLSLKAVRTGR
jgi:hypothetical protein